MKGKIGLEEHFAIDDTLMDSKGFFPETTWQEVRERILDLHGRRLRLMDEFGMQMMILSLNAPAIQAITDPKKANDMEKAWAYPVVANGRLFLRDHGMIWCYDVRNR